MLASKSNEAINLEPVMVSLRSIKLLRSNVKDLFQLLADGNQNFTDSSKDSNEEEEVNFIDEMQNLMTNINQRVRDLENSSALLASSNIISSTNFGNATHLGLDPAQDKQQLYNSMVMTYRWCDKLSDIATTGHLFLNSNQLKRTFWSAVGNPRNRLTPRKALNTGYNIPSAQVEIFIKTLSKQLGFKIEFENSFGEPKVLKVVLDRIFQTIIVLRGFIIEYVNVKGLNESFKNCDDKLDIWSESRYEVFRKITDHLNSAMLHFSAPLRAEAALKTFFIWFKSYNSLFDKECKKCGKKLKNNLPPTWRDNRYYDAYHDVCKSLKPFS